MVQLMEIADKDLHWLVGILEGEGCFGLCVNHQTKKIYHYPQIQLRMNDEDIVERAAKLMNALTHAYSRRNPRHSDYWQFSITCERAALWMQRLYPFMGERRQKRIKEVLKLSDRDYLRKTPIPRLTKEQIQEIKNRLNTGEKQIHLACEYGVSQATISWHNTRGRK